MKKKIFLIIILLCISLNLTSCYKDEELSNANILTTIYPVEYLASRLYNLENSQISSIYPNETDVYKYKLNDKQITDFAKKTNIFIYDGLTDEKEIARKLLNKNKNLQIIDVSYGIKKTYGIEELWLNPNNYLMLAETMKKDLIEISENKYTAEKITENYKELEEELSILDAKIKDIANTAISSNKNTIVIANDAFSFLESYGFKTISVAKEKNVSNTIKNDLKNKKYKYIFVDDKENVPDHIKDMVDNYNVELVEIRTMNTLTDKERENNDTYLSIMNEFISDLSNAVLS